MFNSETQPFVSVLIPARNEEHSIAKCVRSVANCSYPSNRFEIIVVNDRSTDATAEVIDGLTKSISNLRLVNTADVTTETNLKGKPGALQAAADVAQGEILLMTDSDCTVPPAWIHKHVGALCIGNVGLVAGFTVVDGDRLTDRIQDVEWIFTQAMAAGGVGHRVPLGCFGNNLSIKTSVFKEVGGYRSIPFSITEDMALQQAAVKAGYGVRHICREECKVVTQPCNTVLEYIHQHHRWARGGMGLGGKAVGFVITSLLLWTALVYALATGQYSWFVFTLAIKLLGDGTLTASAAVAMKRTRILPYVIPSLLFLLLTELSLPFLILRKNVLWKNQIFKG